MSALEFLKKRLSELDAERPTTNEGRASLHIARMELIRDFSKA